MFLLFTAVDLLAINAVVEMRSESIVRMALMWLVIYSSVAGLVLGARAWKECRGDCPRPQALLRILTCSSLFYAACTAALQFGWKNPEAGFGVYLFLIVYVMRLTPPAAATVLLSPFLWTRQPQVKLLVLVVICQVCCWYGGYRVTGGDPGWCNHFLLFSLWVHHWGFALMVGGLLLKPLLGCGSTAGPADESG